MSTRILVIGPGAIGGCISAYLFGRPETTLHLAARTRFDTLRVTYPDEKEVTFTPSFIDADAFPAEPYDWVIVATKAYDAPSTEPLLKQMVGPATRVAILQNGVEHVARFQDYVPVEQLLPVMIDLPAERLAPGQFKQRGPALLRAPNDEAGRSFMTLFAGTDVDAATSDDFLSVLWRKLTINAPGAVNALLLQPNRIVQQPAIAELMRGIMLEVIAVANAEGAKLDESLTDKILASMRKAAPDGMNSLHADRAHGRFMEVDARNGAVVRAGQRHGIPTPLNTMAATLLEAQQPAR